MRRAVELEVRLSYHDRVLKTLPEPMQTDSNVITTQPPGPNFEYEDPCGLTCLNRCCPLIRAIANPYYDATQSILELLRGRSRVEEVISHLDTLRTSLESTPSAPHPFTSVDALMRSIAVQSLLSIGSRSFSHLLNAIERYLLLLRHLVGDDATDKTCILDAVSTFWQRNRQMVGIVFDKLMQYQIVDPSDVIGWTFSYAGGGVGAFEWDLMRGALDKANGRVVIARRKVGALRKEQDESIARVKATDVGSMEVDGEVKPIERGMCMRCWAVLCADCL